MCHHLLRSREFCYSPWRRAPCSMWHPGTMSFRAGRVVASMATKLLAPPQLSRHGLICPSVNLEGLATSQLILKQSTQFSVLLTSLCPRNSYLLELFCRFRLLCQTIIAHKLFDYVVLAFIFLNCITIALERPQIEHRSMVSTVASHLPFNTMSDRGV